MIAEKYLKIFTKENTSIEHYDGCPSFVEMTGAGFTRPLYGSTLVSYSISASFYRKRQGDYLTPISNQQQVGKAVILSFIQERGLLLDLYEKWLGNFRLLQKFYQRAYLKDFSHFNEDELLAWADEVSSFFKKVQIPGFIDGFMFYADKRLDFLVKEFCERENVPDYQKIYVALSTPIEPSFLNEEEDDLKHTVKKFVTRGYKNGTSLESFLVGQPDLQKEIHEHLLKYSWIKSSYVGYQEYMLDDLAMEVERMIAEPPTQGHDQLSENKQKKQVLEEKYDFSEEIVAITRLTEILVKWQDQRKEYTLMFAALRSKVLEEVSKRIRIDPELLRYCEGRELTDLFTGKLTADELKKRENGCLFIYHGGKTVEIITGKEAIDFIENISRIDVGTIKEITGMVASVGKVRGLVRVITSIANIDKVLDGEVLVAPMTRPEHMPGMKKAAAIVTDDGGITCHAAIVARELKKPCIIGTKIATKVFKDGDLVEVDADKGVVRILEK